MLELAARTNSEGYHNALKHAFENCGHTPAQTPAKSSLSEFRQRVSYEFFEEVYRYDLALAQRAVFRGFHIYAIDGDSLDLPASVDILEHGFNGYPSSRKRETHYPKMYTTQVIDVLSGEIRDFSFSTEQDEVHLARSLALGLEQNSIAIYDRLHCGYESFRAHIETGNYFLIRARCDTKDGSGRGVYEPVREFARSNAKSKTITWRPLPGERRTKPDLVVRLVRVRNPKTKKDYVFVTNIPEDKFTNKEIATLYRRRWQIETSFKDITCTLKLGQWHSTKANGILQEIFALLWLVNSVRRQMKAITERDQKPDPLKEDYRKSNFKLSVSFMIEHLRELVVGRWRKFLYRMKFWIERMTEKRKHNSRSYPRVVKHRGREYKQANLVPRRKALTERH